MVLGEFVDNDCAVVFWVGDGDDGFAGDDDTDDNWDGATAG